MENKKKKIYVVGHKNPDTDSICSAISYAALKCKMTGDDYVAKRAGQINEETRYVLKEFGVEPPSFLSNVHLQVKDMDIHDTEGIPGNTSIKDAWKMMRDLKLRTTAVTRGGKLEGLVSTGDIATAHMDVYDSHSLATARTQYRNILKTLDGELVTGNEHGYFLNGKVAIAASTLDMMESFIEKDDLVILGDRPESLMCAVNLDVSCIVVCKGGRVSERIKKIAEEKSIVIMTTPHDTFTVARLINQSIPVRHFMTKENLMTFKTNEYVEDIKEIMAKNRFHDFPVLDKNGDFRGFISRRRLLGAHKKRVIMVDHNEASQAVDGIEEAEILEIIDHHRLGSIETMGPVYFRNQPVGCTATIVYQLYQEAGQEVEPTIAALLCSAIISDTLLFRSPTCTEVDKRTAEKLAEIAGIDMEKHAQGMFRAGSNLKNKTVQEICFLDFKQFTANGTVFGVGQISSMDAEELAEIKEKLVPYMEEAMKEKELDMMYFMNTNIITESTELLCAGTGAKELIISAFDLAEDTEDILLKGVVSRKKQLIPVLVGSLQQ